MVWVQQIWICMGIGVRHHRLGVLEPGNAAALPAPDEVFSAIHFADIHPLQTLAYYKLPNNHILFNLINNLLFHAVDDKVASGRWISLIAYEVFMAAIFFWLTKLFENVGLAFLATIALSLQFFVWGFGFQARGYEVYLLAEWGMVISMLAYLAMPDDGDKAPTNKQLLNFNAGCIVAGYFCIPTFLFIHAALLAFLVVVGVIYKKRNLILWKYQIMALLTVFLCYLPTLCFSGLQSITANKFVTSEIKFANAAQYFQYIAGYFLHFTEDIFSGVSWFGLPMNMVFFLLPLTLLLARKNRTLFLLGLFYIVQWLTVLCIMSVDTAPLFDRVLIGHYSITLFAVLAAFQYYGNLFFNNSKLQVLRWAALPVVSICFISWQPMKAIW